MFFSTSTVFFEKEIVESYEPNVSEPEYVDNDEEYGNLSLQEGQTFETFEEVDTFLT